MLRFIEKPESDSNDGFEERSRQNRWHEHAAELIEIYRRLIRKETMKPFHYSDYESQLMDQDYIRMLQRPRVRFFKDCKKVLDLAWDPGFFLELLKEAGIEAVGVDRSEAIVEKARRKGCASFIRIFSITWNRTEERYDGIFCSHLLEHLPFGEVVRLVEEIVATIACRGNPRLRFSQSRVHPAPSLRFLEGPRAHPVLHWEPDRVGLPALRPEGGVFERRGDAQPLGDSSS